MRFPASKYGKDIQKPRNQADTVAHLIQKDDSVGKGAIMMNVLGFFNSEAC
jgi:hypothetical protein